MRQWWKVLLRAGPARGVPRAGAHECGPGAPWPRLFWDLLPGAVGLAHHGLSITDLSPAGHQLMTNEDGMAGWLVPAEDLVSLAEAVAMLTALPAMRRGVAAAAQERILGPLEIDRVGAQYFSLYEELSS